MADVTMNSAAIPNITPVAADLLLAWDASAAANGEFPISDLITLFQATFATLSGGNTFDSNQSITKVDPTLTLTPTTGKGAINIASADAGASWGGNVIAGRNSNGSTGAAGFFGSTNRSGVTSYIWADNTGVLRIGGSLPTNANDLSGTVVGAQTSALAAKDIEGEPLTAEEILALIAGGAAAVQRFRYKPYIGYDEEGNQVIGDRPNGGEEFSGVIVDYAPRYGTERDEDHPAGKSLNTINAIGDLLIAVNYLAGQVQELKAQLGTGG